MTKTCLILFWLSLCIKLYSISDIRPTYSKILLNACEEAYMVVF